MIKLSSRYTIELGDFDNERWVWFLIHLLNKSYYSYNNIHHLKITTDKIMNYFSFTYLYIYCYGYLHVIKHILINILFFVFVFILILNDFICIN